MGSVFARDRCGFGFAVAGSCLQERHNPKHKDETTLALFSQTLYRIKNIFHFPSIILSVCTPVRAAFHYVPSHSPHRVYVNHLSRCFLHAPLTHPWGAHTQALKPPKPSTTCGRHIQSLGRIVPSLGHSGCCRLAAGRCPTRLRTV